MNYWKITGRQGDDKGIWQGDEPVDALAAMHRAAGVACQVEDGRLVFDDESQRQTAGGLAEWIVEEAKPEDLLEAVANDQIDDEADAIREARDQLELSRVEFGRLAELPVQENELSDGRVQRKCRTLASWEKGQRRAGRDGLAKLRAIAQAIGRSRDDQGDIDWSELKRRVSPQDVGD
jgi:DNA-binding transcriptional regulator YiaG